MSTRSAVIKVEPDLAEAFNTAPEAKQKKALSAFRRALQKQKPVQSEASRLSKKETELFLRINRTLPEKQAQRLDELNEKIEEPVLTDQEQAELLRLAKRVENCGLIVCRQSLIWPNSDMSLPKK